MADEPKDPPKTPTRDEAERHFTGDESEAAAWAKAFTGSAPPPAAPLEPHEMADIHQAYQDAVQAGDMDAAARIESYLTDPAAYRKVANG